MKATTSMKVPNFPVRSIASSVRVHPRTLFSIAVIWGSVSFLMFSHETMAVLQINAPDFERLKQPPS